MRIILLNNESLLLKDGGFSIVTWLFYIEEWSCVSIEQWRFMSCIKQAITARTLPSSQWSNQKVPPDFTPILLKFTQIYPNNSPANSAAVARAAGRLWSNIGADLISDLISVLLRQALQWVRSSGQSTRCNFLLIIVFQYFLLMFYWFSTRSHGRWQQISPSWRSTRSHISTINLDPKSGANCVAFVMHTYWPE